jgi:hypothetical protein
VCSKIKQDQQAKFWISNCRFFCELSRGREESISRIWTRRRKTWWSGDAHPYQRRCQELWRGQTLLTSPELARTTRATMSHVTRGWGRYSIEYRAYTACNMALQTPSKQHVWSIRRRWPSTNLITSSGEWMLTYSPALPKAMKNQLFVSKRTPKILSNQNPILGIKTRTMNGCWN